MTDLQTSSAPAVPEINAPDYWDQRFATDWEPQQGREQTAFFAHAALAALPAWIKTDIATRQLAIYDFGCALGDALPVLQAAFPNNKISGGDIAPSGIARARTLYPHYAFEQLHPDRPPPEHDVIYCSNTLEHFKDWGAKLEALAGAARAYVIMVVPFAEADLIAEHEVSFSYGSLPLAAGPHRLVCATSFDTGRLANSHWAGRQLAAIYAPATRKSDHPIAHLVRDHATLDFRGQGDAEIRAALQTADAFDASLAAEITTHEALKSSTDRMIAELAHFKQLLADSQNHAARLALQLETQQHALTEARTYSERIAHDYSEMREHFAASREEVVNLTRARDEALETADAMRETLGITQNTIGRITDRIGAHNVCIDQREADITAHVRSGEETLDKVLKSRSWRLLRRAHALIARVRGRSYRPPTAPPAADTSLPRLDITPLLALPAPLLRLSGKQVNAPAGRMTNKSQMGPRALLTVSSLHRGGVEQVVIDLAHGLAALGYRVGVAVADTGGDSAAQLISEGFDVRVFGEDRAGFAPYVRDLNPAFALANHCYMGFDELKDAGVPIIDIVHNYYVWHQDAPDAFRRMCAAMTRCVAVSSGVADYHARTFGIPRAQIPVINNPINPHGLLRPEPGLLKRARNAARPTFTFVNIAQFFPAKAHAVLISAFAEVLARYPEARLLLLGEHVDEGVTNAVRQAIEHHGLAAAVEMPGYLNRRALSHRLATAHAFVQPSVYEGFSVAMAEAAHFALPIIATRVGGALDLVKDNDCGILIPPHIDDLSAYRDGPIYELGLRADAPNRAALVDAMVQMMCERDDWQERGFLAQARIDALTPQSVAQRYVALAESVQQ